MDMGLQTDDVLETQKIRALAQQVSEEENESEREGERLGKRSGIKRGRRRGERWKGSEEGGREGWRARTIVVKRLLLLLSRVTSTEALTPSLKGNVVIATDTQPGDAIASSSLDPQPEPNPRTLRHNALPGTFCQRDGASAGDGEG